MARPGLRSHFTGSVPISIAVHAVAVLMFLIIPLTATIELPEPADEIRLPESMRVVPPPPPPPAVVRVAEMSTTSPATNPDIAPTTAPATIAPEIAPPGIPTPGLQPTEGGVPQGLGILAGNTPVAVIPADPPKPVSQVRVADLPVSPRKTVDVRPVYPEIARIARVEGTIIMEAVLDTSGRVTQLRVLKSVPCWTRRRSTPSGSGDTPRVSTEGIRCPC